MVLPFTEFKVWNSEQMEECIITKSNYYKKLKLDLDQLMTVACRRV